jgi:ribosome recycling factor
MNSVLSETKEKMQAAIDHLVGELSSLRTGKANPAMLDSVQVEVYGSSMRIKDLATTTAPEPRQLLVTPFDAQNAGPIAKAIEKANLGIQPAVDGNVVRLSIPEMSQEVREDMRKLCGKRGEEAKVSVRNVRRTSMTQIKKSKEDGDIPEDQEKRLEKEIQKATDDFCAKIDEMVKTKEKEIVTI